jgi:hypothetical protein
MTREEALVVGALQSLGFELIPSDDKKIGGPVYLKTTKSFVGQIVTVSSDGSVAVDVKQL